MGKKTATDIFFLFFGHSQNPQYDIKESAGGLHTGITQPAAYYPYDHSLGQYQYDRYNT